MDGYKGIAFRETFPRKKENKFSEKGRLLSSSERKALVMRALRKLCISTKNIVCKRLFPAISCAAFYACHMLSLFIDSD